MLNDWSHLQNRDHKQPSNGWYQKVHTLNVDTKQRDEDGDLESRKDARDVANEAKDSGQQTAKVRANQHDDGAHKAAEDLTIEKVSTWISVQTENTHSKPASNAVTQARLLLKVILSTAPTASRTS